MGKTKDPNSDTVRVVYRLKRNVGRHQYGITFASVEDAQAKGISKEDLEPIKIEPQTTVSQ